MRSRTYAKDVEPERAVEYLKLLSYELPAIAPFDPLDGIESLRDALGRKQGVRKGKEDMGPCVAP